MGCCGWVSVTGARAGIRPTPPSRWGCCRASCCAWTPRHLAARATRCRRPTRLWTARVPSRRSGRSGCVTRGGSRLIGPPATCGSATLVSTSSRRSTSSGCAGPAGANFGWRRLEGSRRFSGSPPPNAVPPVHEYAHRNGRCAVIGGHVYRGTQIRGLQGAYVYGDVCDGRIRALGPCPREACPPPRPGPAASRPGVVRRGPGRRAVRPLAGWSRLSPRRRQLRLPSQQPSSGGEVSCHLCGG